MLDAPVVVALQSGREATDQTFLVEGLAQEANSSGL